MEFTLTELFTAFLYSILFGMFFGILYEPFRLFRKLGLTSKSAYFVCDLTFMLICAFLSYFFCVVFIEGRVRFFVIFGEIIGFFVYFMTFRRLSDVIIFPIILIFKKILKKLLKKCRLLLYNIKNRLAVFVKKLTKVIENGRKQDKKEPRGKGKRGNRRSKKAAEKAQ